MQKVLVLNGPNLARLGSREPDIYGSTNYEGLVAAVSGLGADLGLSVEVRQTDSESELIGWLHDLGHDSARQKHLERLAAEADA